MSKIVPYATPTCPLSREVCATMTQEEIPAVAIDFNGTITTPALRPGAIKSFDIANGITFPNGTQAPLLFDLLASTDPGPVVLTTGGIGGNTYIEIPSPTTAGFSDHLVRFSFDPPNFPFLSRWKISFSDIDGLNVAAGGGGIEAIGFRAAQSDGCGSDYQILFGADITESVETTVVDTGTYNFYTGQDDGDQFNDDHTVALISTKREAFIEFVLRIGNNVAGASGTRQFYPTTFSAPFGLPNLCPPIPISITQVTDCNSGLSTFYDGYDPNDDQGGAIIPPTAFNIISYGDCP